MVKSIRFIKLRKKLFALFFFPQTWRARRVYQLLVEEQSQSDSFNYQETYLTNTLYDASKKISYYEGLDSFSISQWKVVDKEIIRKNPKSFIDSHYPFYNRILFNTGGSTGEPFKFYTTRLAGYVDQYHQRYFFEKIGYEKGDKTFSIDGLAVSDKMKREEVYWKKTEYSDLTYGSYSYSSLYLNDDKSIERILQDFNEKKPAFLRGYPSAFTEIARYIDKSGFLLDLKLKGIILTAENILPEQMDLISRIFKTAVYGQYGHSEKCICAYTNANGLAYRCSPYYGYVEILDENDLHVKEGEIGRVVVTSYYNKAMYFIRYDTGDIAEYGGVDDKGWVILNSIIGRKQDFIFDKEKNKINVTALIFGQHLNAFDNIDKWQIEQTEFGEITIKIIKAISYSIEDEKEIEQKFAQWNIKTYFLYVKSIPLTARGKFRLVDSKIIE